MPFEQIKNYSLWYEENLREGKNYLLLHNVGSDMSFLKPQFTFLSALGRVIAVDFPGHGKSETPSLEEISIPHIATAINQFCRGQDLKNLIVIGLNYGANIALELFHQHPTLISKMIMIDPPLLLSEEVRKFIEMHTVELENTNKEEYANELISGAFIHAKDDIKEQAYEVFAKMSSTTLKHLYKDLLEWDKHHSVERLQGLSASSLCIGTDASLCDMRQLEILNPLITTAKVVKSKYWASIEVPEQINAMIERFCLF